MNAATQATSPVRVPLYKGVRCVTVVKGVEPRSWCINSFDVPNENETDGNLTGIKIAYEIMAAARKGDFDSFRAVHDAAFKVLQTSKINPVKAKDGSAAAASYLWTMSEILELAAQNLDLSDLIQDSFFSHEAMLQDTLDEVKAENIAFMASLKEAEIGEVTTNSGAI